MTTPARAPLPVLPGRQPSGKLSLRQQAELLRYIVASWAPGPDPQVVTSPVWLARMQIDDLDAIARTLELFDRHGAGEHVRKQLQKAK